MPTATDDLVLMTIFVNSADVDAVRAALLLPAHLGEDEARFIRCVGQILESLGKRASTDVNEKPRVPRFKTGWIEQFNQDIRELQRLLADLKTAERD